MARLQTGIAFCLLSLLGFISPAHPEETILGKVRLRDNRLIFQSPATPAPAKGYVTVDCLSDLFHSTPTTNAIQPLVTAHSGETLIIVEMSDCKYTNGD